MQNSLILQNIDLQQLETMISTAVNKGIALVSSQTTTTENHNELLTRKEVCELLHITLPTLHDWTKEGVITGYRINTRVRYKKSEVLATLQKVSQLKYRRAV
jgi:excisionase family DNA binding protein